MSQQVDGPTGKIRAIPEATVARLAAYLQALSAMGPGPAAGSPIVVDSTSGATSSEALAAAAGVNSATLRKDLSYLGTYGVRGVGYDIAALTAHIIRALGAHRQHRVALVGVGNLGAALAGYPGFLSRGLVISALFDVSPARIGRSVGGVVVEHFDRLIESCRRESITIGVIATPEPAAQAAADALVAAGVRSILAFTPGVIGVPAEVELRKVDLAVELQILAFHESRRSEATAGARMGMNNDIGADDATESGIGSTRTASSVGLALRSNTGPGSGAGGTHPVARSRRSAVEGWLPDGSVNSLAAVVAVPATSTRSAQ